MVDGSGCPETARVFYFKVMVRKVYFDERENELELFISDDKKMIISIKHEDENLNISLDYYDISEFIDHLSMLHPYLKEDGL